MSVVAVREAMANLAAAYDAFDACDARDLDALTRTELLSVMDDLETLTCRMPTQTHRLLARLQAETSPQQMGAKSWNQVLRIRWRLSTGEASRRLGEAADLAARTSLTGQPLAPLLPAVAAAQSAGLITGEHVGVIRGAIKRLPCWVDTITAGQFEVDLVRVAAGVGPKELRETADLRLFLLDQDGPEPDDAERARKRHFTTAAQGRDAMTAASANFTPAGVGGVGGDLRQIRRTRACATPPTPSRAPPAPPAKPRSTTTTAPWPNANTTRCWRSDASR